MEQTKWKQFSVLGGCQSCLGIGFSAVSCSAGRIYEDRYFLEHDTARSGTCVLNYMALVLIILNFWFLLLQYHLRDSDRKSSPFDVILSQHTYSQPNSVTSVLILLLNSMFFKISHILTKFCFNHMNKQQNRLCREEIPTRCHCMLYCTYDTLNMFRALLCPSSGALDYMYAIAAQGVQCLVAGCRGQVQGSRVAYIQSRAPDDGQRIVRNMLSVS